MIKRRFFKEEHGDNDEQSSSSSSSSDSDADVDAESEDHSEPVHVKKSYEASSSSSGYESENSSADEINVDSAGGTDEDDGSDSDQQKASSLHLSGKRGAGPLREEINGAAQEDSVPDEMQDFVMKFKSAYRCRLCPRILCLTEETMKSHLSSKRHIRSEKLLKENRLKSMLNSDGEIENQETALEMNARIVARKELVAPDKSSKKRNKGRQRQKNRLKKKKDIPSKEKTKEPTKRPPTKKRRKSEG
ncbi:hypothetical protein M5689_007190 [Euphorbia peplus]|nr:hypothetical protein M5689_007190 [Euphorbia peplus]